jgi:Ca-activated chloride channel family protein
MSLPADLAAALGLHDVWVWVAQSASGGWVWPHLAQPAWLALWVLPVLLLIAQWRRRQTVRHYADTPLQPWALVLASSKAHRVRRRAVWGLSLVFWLGLGLSLADPRVPKAADEALQIRPPLLFLIDDSAAMSVADVSPNRLARAVTLVGLLAHDFPDRRLGLMVYANEAGLLLPPASDARLLPFYLKQIAALPHPLAIPRPSTAFEWIARLPEMQGGAVIWLSSGEAQSFEGALGSQQLAGAEALNQAHIRLIALTLAGQGGPLRQDGLPMKTAEGTLLTSTPAPARVAELAKITGGVAGITGTVPSDEKFVREAVAALPNLAPTFALGDQTRSLHALPLVLAWLAAIGMLLATLSPRASSVPAVLLMVLALSMAASVLPAPAWAGDSSDWLNRRFEQAQIAAGNAALNQGDYAEAQAAFAAAKGFAARLGAGVAALRRADFVFAVNQFQMALWLAATPQDQALAAFNLGDALLLTGRYPDALAAFNYVLSLATAPTTLSDAARVNRDIVQKILQMAAKNGANSAKFQGLQIAQYGYAVDPADSKMDKEIQKTEGVLSGSTGSAAATASPNAPAFVLNQADATSARSKLNLIHDQPAPLLDGLLRQQPYHQPALSPEAPVPSSLKGQP